MSLYAFHMQHSKMQREYTIRKCTVHAQVCTGMRICVCMWYATDINAMECSANLECSRMQRCCMIGKCMLMQHECSIRKMRRCGHADKIPQNAQKCIVMRPYADGQKRHRIRAETTRDPKHTPTYLPPMYV